LCQIARARLAEAGVFARVIDLRWLAPLPVRALVDALAGCSHVLVVDETRAAGGVSEGVITALSARLAVPLARLAARDSFIATGPAHAATLPSVDGIVAAAQALIERRT
jgi:2-oxoisovalerate dehydrogenase E1 component